MKGLLAVSLLGIFSLIEAEDQTSLTWAVLVAGSNGWDNYRHQADVCHAYHVLINKGFHPDRIIVMMYDDIANNPVNNHKGQIFNKPDGPDVYKGVKIDYREKDVNIQNFKNVLLGNKDAMKGKGTGRVLESGPNDHVFINFVDHGAPGQLEFPNESLYADDFIKLLKQMKNEEKYGEMVLYIEACESGSMFDNLLGPYENILVSTASAPDESSYGWYCDTGNCLGDLFSITWMERMEKSNFSESLFQQFDAVRTATLQKSHANLYGDYRLGSLQFGRFNYNNNGLTLARVKKVEYENDSGIDSRDVPIHNARKELERSLNSEIHQEMKVKLEKMIKAREFADNLISTILKYFTRGDVYLKNDLENKRYPLNEDMFGCYKSVMKSFEINCYKPTKHTYFLKHLYKFANICVRGYNENDAIQAIEIICHQQNGDFELIV